ncbi:hypothetical protein [Vibrio cholerae]|uniref:hypothetical protein n=1 Tax=Vibrio cholerae TaxID=666 RepID=UPI00301BE15B
MKPKKVSSKEALIKSVAHEYKSLIEGSKLNVGPFFLFMSKHEVLISSEIKKAFKKLPEGYQFVSVSHSITEEAACFVSKNKGISIVKSSFYWTDESAKRNAR